MTGKWAKVGDIIHATNSGRWRRFQITGEDVRHLCPSCDATFPQTDKGWAGLREHQYKEHGSAVMFDWKELQGKTLEITVIETEDENTWGVDWDSVQRDVYGRATDGTVYHLATNHSGGKYHGERKGGWKWRNPPSPERLLKIATPSAAE